LVDIQQPIRQPFGGFVVKEVVIRIAAAGALDLEHLGSSIKHLWRE
jgi:hypothetical protein